MLDDVDRQIINTLQGGFPICARPYEAAAADLGLSEDDLVGRIERLLADGYLSRFGPMFHAEKLGGGLTLAAMAVPAARFDAVAEQVNGFDEVAHNYARDHDLNMWFVIAAEQPGRIDEVIAEIETQTGIDVVNLPKQEEFFIGLRIEA